jgi:outer membrane immunogenic protein
MRVLYGLVVLVLLCGSQATAQETSWGVKGGVNLATLSSEDPDTDFKYRIGLVVGGFFTWPLGAHLDLQPEGLFSQQGAKLSDTAVVATIKIESLVVPILVRYKLRPSGRGLVFFAGPSLGFKLSAKATAEAGGQNTNDDIGEALESFDYGVVFGAGWEAGRFSIDGRYTWGLSRLGVDEDDSDKTTHRVITVLAGVRF